MYSAFGCGDLPTILSHLANDVSWEAEDPEGATEFFELPAFDRYEATLAENGKVVDSPVAPSFGFRDGKVCRCINLVNSGASLEALEA